MTELQSQQRQRWTTSTSLKTIHQKVNLNRIGQAKNRMKTSQIKTEPPVAKPKINEVLLAVGIEQKQETEDKVRSRKHLIMHELPIVCPRIPQKAFI